MKYTALTIGPIYKTLTKSQKTRELWGASYLFSYLMKQIIKQIKQKEIKIILPCTESVEINGDKIDILEGKYEAGLFPDRLIFESTTNLDLKEVERIINLIIENISSEIFNHLKQLDNKTVEDKDFFKSYFKVYAVEREFSGSSFNEITQKLFTDLDLLEHQDSFVLKENANYMKDFLSVVSFRRKNKPCSFLIEDSLNVKEDQRVKFDSLIEIAAKELIDKLTEEEKVDFDSILNSDFKNEAKSIDSEEKLINFLKTTDSTKEYFKTYHKYIAIVHIDGDNFGKINKHLDDTDFIKFSDCLVRFSLRTNQTITKYGGLPVYVGGDDALFFAPVRTLLGETQKNIFDLIDEIDEIFMHEFKEIIDNEKSKDNGIIPSLSAGISISYYKFPLEEALEASRNQLFNVAKKMKGKDAVAFTVLKHSGKGFGACINKHSVSNKNNNEVYNQFKKMIKTNIDKNNLLNSVSNKLFANTTILDEIGGDTTRVCNYFDNNFNEGVHKVDGTKEFIENVSEFIPVIYNCPDKKHKPHEILNGCLRTVKFLNRKDNE